MRRAKDATWTLRFHSGSGYGPVKDLAAADRRHRVVYAAAEHKMQPRKLSTATAAAKKEGWRIAAAPAVCAADPWCAKDPQRSSPAGVLPMAPASIMAAAVYGDPSEDISPPGSEGRLIRTWLDIAGWGHSLRGVLVVQ